MSSLRVIGGAPRLAMQRFTKMSGLFQSSPATATLSGAAMSSCLNLRIQTQARFTSALRVTAFEQAMQELYGEAWKQQLNSRQRTFVKFHEQQRQKRTKGVDERKARGWDARYAEGVDERQPEWEWREKVEKKKTEIQWQKKVLSSNLSRSWKK